MILMEILCARRLDQLAVRAGRGFSGVVKSWLAGGQPVFGSALAVIAGHCRSMPVPPLAAVPVESGALRRRAAAASPVVQRPRVPRHPQAAAGAVSAGWQVRFGGVLCDCRGPIVIK